MERPALNAMGTRKKGEKKIGEAGAIKPKEKRAAFLTPAQQRILNSIRWLEVMGITPAPRTSVAFVASVSSESSGFANNLGAMRTAGLIEYASPGTVSLTDDGRATAHTPAQPGTLEELHRAFLGFLPPAHARILSVAIERYPGQVSREDAAQLAEQSATSSGFSNNLGRLRSLGLIDYPQPGYIKATPLLFPASLMADA